MATRLKRTQAVEEAARAGVGQACDARTDPAMTAETRGPLEKTTAVDRKGRERVEAGATDAGSDVDALYEEAVFGGPPTVTGCRPPRLDRGRRRLPTHRPSDRDVGRSSPGPDPGGLRLCVRCPVVARYRGLDYLRQAPRQRIEEEGLRPFSARTGVPVGQLRSLAQGRASMSTHPRGSEVPQRIGVKNESSATTVESQLLTESIFVVDMCRPTVGGRHRGIESCMCHRDQPLRAVVVEVRQRARAERLRGVIRAGHRASQVAGKRLGPPSRPTGSFPASAPRCRSREERSSVHARTAAPTRAASPSRFRHMRSAMRSRFICSRPVPTCAPSSPCSGIGVCRPRRRTCGSRPVQAG